MQETQSAQSLTVRQITERANVNTAMISYYYGSKDELIRLAADAIVQTEAGKWLIPSSQETDPKRKFKDMLIKMSDTVVTYFQFTKVSLNHALLKGEADIPQTILPLMRAAAPDMDERELRLLSFVLTSGLQSILVRHEAFKDYTGYDPFDKTERDAILNRLADMFLTHDFKNKEKEP